MSKFRRARNIKKQDLKAQLDEQYQEVREFFDDVTAEMSPLDKAALATIPVPILGDVLGLTADMANYFTKPESRTWFNFAMSAAGALPFVPPAVVRKPGVIDAVQERVKLFGDKKARVENVTPGDIDPAAIDQRFSPRKLVGKRQPPDDARRVEGLDARYEARDMPEPDRLSIFDMEGRPFVTSMSDRTAAGARLTGINDIDFDIPVDLRGGQDYMFDLMNRGQVWASDARPVRQLEAYAKTLADTTGQSPIYLPFRMSPSGGDYATMTTDTMLEYARKNMSPDAIKEANDAIRNQGRRISKKDADGNYYSVMIKAPEFKGLENMDSIAQSKQLSGDQRKMIQEVLDKDFRKQGSLGITESRLAVSDPRQLAAREGGLQNVGLFDLDSDIIDVSGHPTYSSGLPGRGMGLLSEDVGVFQLLPGVMRERGMADALAPTANDLRALQMKPYGGIITEDILRAIQDTGIQP